MLYRVLILTLLLAACVPQMKSISGRNPDLFEKESDHLIGKSRGDTGSAAPDMYVKQKQIAIKDNRAPNETGSLFNPDDERNYLFTPTGPLNVGRFLKIKIVANHGESKKDEAAAAKADKETAKAAKDGKGAEKTDGDLEADLLKSLPELEPAKKGHPDLQKTFKMQILHKYDNGDVLAMVTRRSEDGEQAAEVVAQARIPYDRLSSGDELTTDDLLDVNFRESRDGEVAERASSSWEDEYSLRLSGFNEARSKHAQELADQKKKLEETKEKLETRIKGLGDERRQVAKTRDDLNQKKADQEKQVADLEGKVKDQQDEIQKQQEEIQKLTPEQKPGDGKEGGNG